MDAATAALINNLQDEFLPRRRPARACVAAAKQKLADEAREEKEERLKAAREAKERAAAKKAARNARKVERAQENSAAAGELGENEGPDGPGVEDEEEIGAGLDPGIHGLRCMWELAAILNFLQVRTAASIGQATKLGFSKRMICLNAHSCSKSQTADRVFAASQLYIGT